MNNYEELKRIAKAATRGVWRAGKNSDDVVADHPAGHAQDQQSLDYYGGHLVAESIAAHNREFIAAANPAVVLALIAENERLRESDQEATELCDTLSVLLGEVAVAVRGPEEPKSRHGFHDLPRRVKTVVGERDQLKAEVEALRAELAWSENDSRDQSDLIESLRKDAQSSGRQVVKLPYDDCDLLSPGQQIYALHCHEMLRAYRKALSDAGVSFEIVRKRSVSGSIEIPLGRFSK